MGGALVAVPRHKLLVLRVHIDNVDARERARRGAEAEQRAGVFGVRVNANGAVVADDDGGRGGGHDALAQRVGVQAFAEHDELRAVAVHLLFGVLEEFAADGGGGRALRGGDAEVRLLSGGAGGHAREEGDDALPSGVHDARLFEDGQLLRRALQRGFGGGAGRAKRFGGGFAGRGVRPGAHHGEHRALDGVADGLIARVGGGAERGG